MRKSKIENGGGRVAIFDPLSSILGCCALIVVLVLTFAQPGSARALEVPALKGRVNDYAGMLPVSRARDLEERLKQFEEQTGHQIALLTIPTLQGESLEGFGIKVADRWKLGQKGFDNGAIFLIARDDRALRIEVGYGLEGVLPDAISSRIVREIVIPRFRADDYPGGIEAGLEAIMQVARGEPLPERKIPSGGGAGSDWWVLLFLASFIIVAVLTQLTNRRVRNSWIDSGHRGRMHGGGPFYGGGHGRGGFGGGFGGGGFSGGGGGFGGGGASGRW